MLKTAKVGPPAAPRRGSVKGGLGEGCPVKGARGHWSGNRGGLQRAPSEGQEDCHGEASGPGGVCRPGGKGKESVVDI